jgi:hypothetical protein
VAASILLWFASAFAVPALQWDGLAAFLLVHGLGVGSAILALAAYDPPAAVRRHGIYRAGDEEEEAHDEATSRSPLAQAARPNKG